MALFNILFPDTEVILVEQCVDSGYWKSLARRTLDPKELKLDSAEIKVDYGSDWYWFHLDEFRLEAESDLVFEFIDITNPYWKSGMKWDFIQALKSG